MATMTDAWNSAAAALPAGWRLQGLQCSSTGLAHSQRGDEWIAEVCGPDGECVTVESDEPGEALTTLAERLADFLPGPPQAHGGGLPAKQASRRLRFEGNHPHSAATDALLVDRGEPPHLHVEGNGRHAKFWLDGSRLHDSAGYNRQQLARITRIIEAHASEFTARWHDYFD